ncbi:16S rRNA (guanine966-N2)-methyltransferase [Chitinivorax tropicus]|uniref:16S rRNA (Guanine966-N2)-methyltransferase n=1 Tax=Chitinivorax tropicus TaxID=714531 RepID=A0A840MLH7_9PROT|nr:16S rRNA (guanine(966)-N(2))-methyltransferase RsmD [Chitinivorax tropicus]MBB5017396.1 16S rRNA (guanine966-N2)-methyltransferase [Chitinivorax tropicus]
MYRNKVRIIGGEWKRRQLAFPDQDGLRPTSDRVRETLFNWLGQDLTGLSCLDVFAGSGALGLEAASRLAKRVQMVEMSREVVQAIRQNVQWLSANNVEVVQADAVRFLTQCRDQFDVIFLDPPFKSDLLARTLPLAAACAKPEGVIYVESATVPDLPTGWQIRRQGKAGAVHYLLLEQRDSAESTA